MKKLYSTSVFILLATLLYAQQETEKQIFIKEQPVTQLLSTTYDIRISSDKISIYYERGDSLNRRKMVRFTYGKADLLNRSFQLNQKKNLSKADSLLRDSADVLSKKLDSAMRAVTFYTRDTIVIKGNSVYWQLLDSVLHATTETLMKERSTRSFLDGVTYTIQLKNGNSIRKLTADTPDQTSQPLIATLVDQTGALVNNHRKKGK
ncbi:MAG: hypothetical protein REI78_05895 [Pedobacter sp.]|nr:hypothetical protein [Pedobacter sp.]MDQ8052535.1 hypothetical protein [Pedobacter sp.]